MMRAGRISRLGRNGYLNSRELGVRNNNKVASQRFKVCTFCVGNYRLGRNTASRKIKIDDLKKVEDLPDDGAVVQLMKELLKPWEYVVDNLFTRVASLIQLKKIIIGLAAALRMIVVLSNKKYHWWKIFVTTVEDEVSWCDNKADIFMTTAHSKGGPRKRFFS